MKQLIYIGCLVLFVGCGSGEAAPEAPPVQPVALDVPEGMVYVPGGTTRIGTEDGLPNEAPPFEATVAPFFLDRSPVTVARFRAFVDSTGYETEAERFGDGGLFDLEARGWTLRQGDRKSTRLNSSPLPAALPIPRRHHAHRHRRWPAQRSAALRGHRRAFFPRPLARHRRPFPRLRRLHRLRDRGRALRRRRPLRPGSTRLDAAPG